MRSVDAVSYGQMLQKRPPSQLLKKSQGCCRVAFEASRHCCATAWRHDWCAATAAWRVVAATRPPLTHITEVPQSACLPPNISLYRVYLESKLITTTAVLDVFEHALGPCWQFDGGPGFRFGSRRHGIFPIPWPLLGIGLRSHSRVQLIAWINPVGVHEHGYVN